MSSTYSSHYPSSQQQQQQQQQSDVDNSTTPGLLLPQFNPLVNRHQPYSNRPRSSSSSSASSESPSLALQQTQLQQPIENDAQASHAWAREQNYQHQLKALRQDYGNFNSYLDSPYTASLNASSVSNYLSSSSSSSTTAGAVSNPSLFHTHKRKHAPSPESGDSGDSSQPDFLSASAMMEEEESWNEAQAQQPWNFETNRSRDRAQQQVNFLSDHQHDGTLSSSCSSATSPYYHHPQPTQNQHSMMLAHPPDLISHSRSSSHYDHQNSSATQPLSSSYVSPPLVTDYGFPPSTSSAGSFLSSARQSSPTIKSYDSSSSQGRSHSPASSPSTSTSSNSSLSNQFRSPSSLTAHRQQSDESSTSRSQSHSISQGGSLSSLTMFESSGHSSPSSLPSSSQQGLNLTAEPSPSGFMLSDDKSLHSRSNSHLHSLHRPATHNSGASSSSSSSSTQPFTGHNHSFVSPSLNAYHSDLHTSDTLNTQHRDRQRPYYASSSGAVQALGPTSSSSSSSADPSQFAYQSSPLARPNSASSSTSSTMSMSSLSTGSNQHHQHQQQQHGQREGPAHSAHSRGHNFSSSHTQQPLSHAPVPHPAPSTGKPESSFKSSWPQLAANFDLASLSADSHFKVVPGEVIAHRYEVCRILGRGTFAQALLCRDLFADQLANLEVEIQNAQGAKSSSPPTSSSSSSSTSAPPSALSTDAESARAQQSRRAVMVAVKVVRNVERYRAAAEREARLLQFLTDKRALMDPDSMQAFGAEGCVPFLGSFLLPAGHQCLVFPVLGLSLYNFLRLHSFRPLLSAHVRHVAFQLLLTCHYLHDQCGIIHADIKPENILFVDSSFTSVRIGQVPVNVPLNTAVRLIDFGTAVYSNQADKPAIVASRAYRSVEVVLGIGWSTGVDLWAIGCVLMELYSGQRLFNIGHGDAEHLLAMEQVLGPIPQHLQLTQRQYPPAGEAFEPALVFNSLPTSFTSFTQNQSFKGHSSSSASQTGAHTTAPLPLHERIVPGDLYFYDLVSRLLAYDPKERVTAHQALQHPYFRLPASNHASFAADHQQQS